MIKQLLLLLSYGFILHSFAQVPTPGKKQRQSILYTGGIIHIGNGRTIPDGMLGLKDGVIDVIGETTLNDALLQSYDTTISLNNSHIYPGFIALNSILGLVEIGAVRATKDFREVEKYAPNTRSIIAYNTASKIIPTVRSNGVLMGQITPKGGRISGSSSIVQFDAWNWEDAILKEDDGIHINWPNNSINSHHHHKRNKQKKNTYSLEKEELINFFKKAYAYKYTPKPPNKNLKFEAMKGLFDGSKRLYVHTNGAKEMLDIIAFKKQLSIKTLHIVGGYESPLITEELKINDIGVILRRVHDLPIFPDDPIDEPFAIAVKLIQDDVLVALENSGDMEAMQTRNLPFYVGTIIAYGVDKEKALQTITLNAAKIIGLDQTIGSLEKGKSATFIISTGDVFDMKSSTITEAYIQGRKLDLNNHQKILRDQYELKYKQAN